MCKSGKLKLITCLSLDNLINYLLMLMDFTYMKEKCAEKFLYRIVMQMLARKCEHTIHSKSPKTPNYTEKPCNPNSLIAAN